jgi:hypothetical protein
MRTMTAMMMRRVTAYIPAMDVVAVRPVLQVRSAAVSNAAEETGIKISARYSRFSSALRVLPYPAARIGI